MPMIGMQVDDSTLMTTSLVMGLITFGFCASMGMRGGVSLVLGVIVGAILYGAGVVPVGILIVVGISMIAAIFRGIFSSENDVGSSAKPRSSGASQNISSFPESVNSKISINSAAIHSPVLESKVATAADGPNTMSMVEGKFSVEGGGFHDPYRFGVSLIPGALEVSKKMVDGMVGSETTQVQKLIMSSRAQVQLHSLALICAVYYFCASHASGSSRPALTRLAMGLQDGFAAIFDPEVKSNSALDNAHEIYELVKSYCQTLAREVNSNNKIGGNENPFDMGDTARFFVDNIAIQCGIEKLLEASPGERLMLGMIARDFGVFALVRMLKQKQIIYLE